MNSKLKKFKNTLDKKNLKLCESCIQVKNINEFDLNNILCNECYVRLKLPINCTQQDVEATIKSVKRDRLFIKKYNRNPKHLSNIAKFMNAVKNNKSDISRDENTPLYSVQQFKNHIESLFTEGMTWDNYGEWQIDHIRDRANFQPNVSTRVVNALLNLQPLWRTTRIINGIEYIGNLNKKKLESKQKF